MLSWKFWQLTEKKNRRMVLPFRAGKLGSCASFRDVPFRFLPPKGVLPMYTRVVELNTKSGKASELTTIINNKGITDSEKIGRIRR
jgi:hypothetical protein